MSITTKTGDKGTSTWQGKTVDKDSELLEAVGALDELQATILIMNYELKIKNLEEVVTDLYEVMGDIAYGQVIKNYELKIKNLETEIEIIEKELKPLHQFLVFKNEKAVRLNWARTVCRRAERRLVSLNKVQQIDPKMLIYINRLSDYLFMFARQKEE